MKKCDEFWHIGDLDDTLCGEVAIASVSLSMFIEHPGAFKHVQICPKCIAEVKRKCPDCNEGQITYSLHPKQGIVDESEFPRQCKTCEGTGRV